MYQKFFKGCNWLTSVSDSGIPGWSGHKKGRTEARPVDMSPFIAVFHFRLFSGILSGVAWLATQAFHSSSDDGSLQTRGCVS